MSEHEILSSLRLKTRPIHKELDQKGIGLKIKSNSFNAEDYKKWLSTTIKINSMLFEEKKNFRNSVFFKYVNGDLGLQHLYLDLGRQIEMDFLMEDLKKYHHHSDYLIAIVYTYLGSSLGSTMIRRYVHANIPGASTSFLDSMSSKVELWKSFLAELNDYQSEIRPESIGLYGEAIFQHILELQQ